MSDPTIVIGCGAAKLDHAAPARDLYIGQQFRMARRVVEYRGYDWLILSGRHGLLYPEEIIRPYDYFLGDSVPRRKLLTRLLTLQRSKWPKGQIESWCARRYTQAMKEARMPVVSAPLDGLGVGECYTWLYERMFV